MKKYILCALTAALLLTACGSDRTVPTDAVPTKHAVTLYPDYTNLVIPSNIAPLNFMVRDTADAYAAVVSGSDGQVIADMTADGKAAFDETEWHELLEKSGGKTLTLTVYTKKEGKWHRHPATTLSVAEPIDRYLSYRLIEPSYELYRQMGLYQRDLTTFEEKAIYENNRSYDTLHNHCVNCHNYQNYSTRRMLFHVRGTHGGTVFIENGKIRKYGMKTDSILSAAVYPTWHPQQNWVVFSSNQTGQAFRLIDPEKIEVMDFGSDLIFFDAEKGTLFNILKTEEKMETFPCWAPDGKKVYYCSADVPQFKGLAKGEREDLVTQICDSLHYNLMSITFDPATRTFGTPVLEMDCAAEGLSASVPRVSPDGRYVLFTMGKKGQFHIWHKTSDLYVKDLQTDSIRPLTEANSPDVDSYHTWSSNGRWIVFSSRRDDGSYTRPYIAYFDADGRAHKAFILPQEDPEYNLTLLKSYNVPELSRDAVPVTPEALKEAIYDDAATLPVNYGGRK